MQSKRGNAIVSNTSTTRRRGFAALLTGATAALVLSSCGAARDYTDVHPELPDYYPADYSTLVEASKAEGGSLTIYSNTDQQSWAPIILSLIHI